MNIPIHPRDKKFISLMQQTVFAIRTSDKELLDKVKKEFIEAEISLYYNKEKDVIRVVKQGGPPIDFEAKRFEKTKE